MPRTREDDVVAHPVSAIAGNTAVHRVIGGCLSYPRTSDLIFRTNLRGTSPVRGNGRTACSRQPLKRGIERQGAVVVVDGVAVGGLAVDDVSSTPSDVRTELARIAARTRRRSISRRVSACGHGTSCGAWIPRRVRAMPMMVTGAIATGGRGIESERLRSSSTRTRP